MDHTLKSQVLGQFDWFSADNKTMKEEMSDDYLCTSVSHFFFFFSYNDVGKSHLVFVGGA